MRNFFAFTLGFFLCSLAGYAAPSISQPGGTGGPASSVAQGVGADGGTAWDVAGVVAVSNHPATYPVTDNGGSLTVDGTVAVSSVAGSVAVTGTFWQATQPISGTVTCNAGSGPFPVSDNGGALTVDGTVTANAGTGPWPVTDNGGSLTVDGTVAISGTVAVTDNAGSLTVDGTVTANAGSGTFTVGGVDSNDSAISGNPVLVGVAAESDGAALATVTAEGDVTELKASLEGRLLVQDHHPNRFHASSGLSTATTLTQIQAAPGAGVSLYVTDIVMSASVASTTTTDQQLTLKYGTGTNCGTGTTYLTGCFNQANGGCAVNLRTPIKLPANNALCWMHAAAGSKIISVTGYAAP